MRKYGTRRRFRRRRNFRRPATGFRRIRRVVKRTLWRNAETKFITSNYASVDIRSPHTGEYSWFNGLAQGTTAITRIGNKIHAKAIGCRLTFQIAWGNGGSLSAQIRILVLYPRKGVDTSTLNTYLTIGVPGLYGRVDPTLFYVMKDKSLFMQPANNNVAGGLPSIRQWKWYKKVRYILNYQADNSVDREPILYIISSIAQADATTLTMSGYMSTSFKDF